MSLFACGSIHQGHERFSDESRRRQEVFLCVWLLYYEWRPQDIDQVLLPWRHIFFSVHSSMSRLPTTACWSREKREEGVKPTCFVSKATSVPQPNHLQYSSPVEALKLIVESKSLPVEVNNSTIELHLSVEAKEKLAIIDSKCGSLVKANHSTKMQNVDRSLKLTIQL